MLIPIVFCADKNYLMPLQVALESLLQNKSEDIDYDIYIMHSNDFDIKTLESSVRKHKTILHFIAMGDAYQSVRINNPIWSKATYYRLNIHMHLPELYKKCIYCDCDVIINCDLKNLFLENINNYYIAGIKDHAVSHSDNRNIIPDEYINAGILLINLEKWRDIHIEKSFLKYEKMNLKFQDQDIINLSCKNKILFLESNKYIISDVLNKNKHTNFQDGIIHYCGLIKPWDIAINNSFFKLWTYYANKVSANINNLLEDRRKNINDYLNAQNIKNVIVWGMTASALDFCFFLEELGLEVSAIGDNNEQKVLLGTPYYKMITADKISYYKNNNLFIVMSNRYYLEIKHQIMRNGVLQNRIIHWNDLKKIMYNTL